MAAIRPATWTRRENDHSNPRAKEREGTPTLQVLKDLARLRKIRLEEIWELKMQARARQMKA